MPPFEHLGEVLALAAPFCWSFAVILFRITGRHVAPLPLNLFKNVLGVLLFAGTLFLLGEPLLRPVPARELVWLLVSGAIGVGLSDALLFASLNRLGAGLQAIVSTSYSPIIIALSTLFLGERLRPAQAVGAALIVSAVAVVGWVRDPRARARVPGRRLGIVLGLAAMLSQGVSIVMIKPLLERSPLVWATAWRLLGGVVVLLPLVAVTPRWRAELRVLARPEIYPALLPASILGTYVALLLWVGGMKYAPASIAAALNQTSTLWTFLLAVLILREPVTPRRIAGVALGLIGVGLVGLG